MKNTLSSQRITVFIIIAFLAFVVGAFIGKHWQKPLAQIVKSATVLPAPRALNVFTLVDMQNKQFTNNDLKGHWTLLFFGFTHCGYICPTTMSVLKQVYENLQTDKIIPPEILFISIDPVRDTPQRIKEYVTSFNQNFQGATGGKQQLDQLTKSVSVVYMEVKKSDMKTNPMDYQIDHSGTLLLINPKGELFAVFSMPHDANSIAKDIEVIEARARG